MDLSKSIGERLKKDLERQTCRIHLKHPTIKILSKSDGFSLDINGCCAEFVEKLKKEAADRTAKAAKEQAEKELSDMFKKLQ